MFLDYLIKYTHEDIMKLFLEVQEFHYIDFTSIAADSPVNDGCDHEVSTELRWETINTCWDWWHGNWFCSLQMLGTIQYIVYTLFELHNHKILFLCMLDEIGAHSVADILSILHFTSICNSTATNRYFVKSCNPLLRTINHILSAHFGIHLWQASIEE